MLVRGGHEADLDVLLPRRLGDPQHPDPEQGGDECERRPDCEVYAWTLRDPLPRIPIPLLALDPDVVLDLGAVFATAYERGRYVRLIDYAAPLTLVRPTETAAASPNEPASPNERL